MATSKIAITLDEKTLQILDRFVRTKVFPSRSSVIQAAVAEKLERLEHGRLARECSKLDRYEEQSLADLGMVAEAREWPEY